MKKILIALASTLFVSTAMAQPYVTAGATAVRSTAQGITDSRTQLSLGAGYRFGAFAVDGSCAGDKACSVGGLGFLPLGQSGWSAIGKLAAYHLKGEATEASPSASVGGVAAPAARTASWSGWAPGAGVGAQYQFQNGFGIRALLEQTGSTGQLDRARLMSVGVTFSF